MKIEVGKFYRTESGHKVEIYSTDNGGDFPIHARIYYPKASSIESYTSEGRILLDNVCRNDIIGEWIEPLDFNWDCLPKWANKYIAQDEDMMWYGYAVKPEFVVGREMWDVKDVGQDGIVVIPNNFEPKNFTGDWKDSLFENPNNVKKGL